MFTIALIAVGLFFSQAPSSEDPGLRAQRGKEALSAGKFAEAIAIYQDLVKTLPNVPGLRMNLGMAQMMAGKPAEAVTQLKVAVQADPELTSAWLFLGAAYLELGKPADAVEPLQQYVRREPHPTQGKQMLADALLGAERFDEAEKHFRDSVRLDSKNAHTWYSLGRSYEGLSAKAFDQLLKAAPGSSYSFALIGDSRVAQQLYASAFYFYRKALEEKPDMRGIHSALAEVYKKTDHADWAAAEEQRELQLGQPDCAAEKISCDFAAGRFEEVLAALKRPQTPEAFYWLSRAYNQLALEAFSKLASLPPSFEFHQFMAEIHRNQKHYSEAAREWEKALTLSPGNAFARRELAVCYALGRDYERARQLVMELLQTNPESAEWNGLAGDMLLNQEQPGEAIPFLEKALRADAHLISAHASLGRAYLTIGEASKAIPHLKQSLANDPDGSLHYQLARAYQSAGHAELARETLQKYQEIKRRSEEETAKLEKEVQITPP